MPDKSPHPGVHGALTLDTWAVLLALALALAVRFGLLNRVSW
jgi:hypothetical protein